MDTMLKLSKKKRKYKSKSKSKIRDLGGKLIKHIDESAVKGEKEYKVKKWRLHEMGRLVYCLWQVHLMKYEIVNSAQKGQCNEQDDNSNHSPPSYHSKYKSNCNNLSFENKSFYKSLQ